MKREIMYPEGSNLTIKDIYGKINYSISICLIGGFVFVIDSAKKRFDLISADVDAH